MTARRTIKATEQRKKFKELTENEVRVRPSRSFAADESMEQRWEEVSAPRPRWLGESHAEVIDAGLRSGRIKTEFVSIEELDQWQKQFSTTSSRIPGWASRPMKWLRSILRRSQPNEPFGSWRT